MSETATPLAIHEAIVSALEPLQLLRFKRSVKVMTVQSTAQRGIGLPWYIWTSSRTQCTAADCLALAESFGDIKALLCDYQHPRYELTHRQHKWLCYKELFPPIQSFQQ
ncbi:MAG: hypothetical protein Q9202_004343, partial [Teloschistes flavicans]